MTITITLENYRGCASAQIECAPIALVGGRNAAGKTSLAQGVGSALCGKLSVPGNLPRSAGGMLVRAGAGSASIEVRSADGVARMVWPSGQASAQGNAPAASEWAAGVDSIVNLSARDRARILSDALHAEPTKDDVMAALDELGIIPAAPIWTQIEGHGWDGAHALRKEQGAQLKGMWRGVTGVVYGSRVGASWRPDLANLDEAELVSVLSNATAQRDRAIAAQAVTDAERRRLEELAELFNARTEAMGRASGRVAEYTRVAQQAQEARSKLPPSDRVTSFPCPHCGGPLAFERSSLVETRVVAASEVSPNNRDLERRRQDIASADGALAHAYDDLQQARRDHATAETAVQESRTARERLENWPRAVERTISATEADAAVAAAQKRLTECRAKKKADDIHAQIEAGERVIDLLAGDGLRQAKLARVLDGFQTTMRNLSEPAGWSPVTIGIDMALMYGGRPYFLLSASEQFRVRVVLQVAMAWLEGASMVVIDGADVLDGPGRNGLFALLGVIKIPALVCMTFSRREQLPDLAAAGLAPPYWIDAGVIDRPDARAA